MKYCATCGRPFTGRGAYDSEFCRRARPCKVCGTLKVGRGLFCVDCRRDRATGIELTNDPEWQTRWATREERPKRRPTQDTPEGLWWCTGCRVWLSPRWFLTWKALQANQPQPDRCRPCRSARQHAARIKADFGLTITEYDELLALQGGMCAICGNRPKTARLAVDHSHIDNRIRGLLCSRCNKDLLDAIHHSAHLASRAALYLQAPPAQTGRPVPDGITLSRQAVENLLLAHPDLAEFLKT